MKLSVQRDKGNISSQGGVLERRERYRERTQEIDRRSPGVFSAVHIQMKELWRSGKEPTERIQESIQSLHGAGRSVLVLYYLKIDSDKLNVHTRN